MAMLTLLILTSLLNVYFVLGSVDENGNSEHMSDEARLVRHLLGHYGIHNTIARPLQNSSDIITVGMSLRLIKIDVSEKDQSFKTSVWLRLRWRDEHLKWDPAEYGGMNTTILPWKLVWIPDISLVNTAETDVYERSANIMVTHQGAVAWSPHRVYKSACFFDVTRFPYDTHRCDLWFQAMSRYSWQMDLQLIPGSSLDLSTYLESYREGHRWRIIETSAQRFNGSQEAGVTLKYSRRVSLRFSVVIQRDAGYIGPLLMVPCILMGLSTLVIFGLQPDNPDRISIAMSLLASFIVLLLILVEAAPPSAAAVPKLGIFYGFVMLLIMFSPFLWGLVDRTTRKAASNKPLSPWARRIFFRVLAPCLFLRDRVSLVEETETARRPTLLDLAHPDGLLSSREKFNRSSRRHANPPPLVNTAVQLEETLKVLIAILQNNQQETPTDSTRGRSSSVVSLQWALVSSIMDRICFCLYSIVLILATIFFFPHPW